jgi:hypothetical protein
MSTPAAGGDEGMLGSRCCCVCSSGVSVHCGLSILNGNRARCCFVEGTGRPNLVERQEITRKRRTMTLFLSVVSVPFRLSLSSIEILPS